MVAPIRIFEGSAKNTYIYQEPTATKQGKGIFEFLNYFSIFDWGRFLKNPIVGKGIAMTAVAKKHFELFEKAGIPTHFENQVDNNKIAIKVVKIPDAYKNVVPGTKNYLLPIEIIFRIYTHPQSSDLKKIKEGKRTWQELGYEEMPEPNKKLPHVKISWSTKLEAEDRVLTKEEARVLAGLTQSEMDRLEELALKVNDIITKHSEKVGMIHYDGKIEVAKDADGDFMVVDVAGTLDEDRFMVNIGNGKFVDMSKQFLRNWFITNGWKAKVDVAKKKAEADRVEDWTTLCEPPPKLPEKISALVTEMYLADAEARAGLNCKELGFKLISLKEVAKSLWEVEQTALNPFLT